MATLNGSTTRRRNRRKLGRNQTSPTAAVAVAVTSTGTTNLTMTFARPVMINGTVGTAVATRTLVSQTVVSPTVVTQVWSGNVTGLAFSLNSSDPAISTYQGGRNAAVGGTFP